MAATVGDFGRVRAYIDGFNLYHGMLEADLGHFRWLDHAALAERLIGDAGDLRAVHYFTSKVFEPDRESRQRTYLKALRDHGRAPDRLAVTISYGRFEKRSVKCGQCSEWFRRDQEKETDVRLATSIIADAFDDLYDTLLLISADADLVPAVTYVKERFDRRLFLVDPPERHSDELRALADNERLRISDAVFVASQLPDPVERIWNGRVKKRWHRPEAWGTHGADAENPGRSPEDR